MARPICSSIEPLEARIAPAALPVLHPFPDLIAGIGKTGDVIDLGNAFDVDGNYHTLVEFTTNFDTDAATPGLQAGKIVIELYDDATPLTVQNFLAYVTEKNAKGDYTNTFFHRLVDDFVLQGGGFNSETFSHIVTKPMVHNEFATAYPGFGDSTTDDLRANVRGTVAMAKVGAENGGGPNSATSEWFVNLGDNSANLDVQNGGFTVFGRVTDASMLVVDAIANRPTADIRASTQNGALSDVPYNPGYVETTTNSPKPTLDQLIRITGVNVTAPLGGEAPSGTTYSFAVTDAAGNPTDLVTGQLTGDNLALTYKTGSSGVAKVKVTAMNGPDTAVEEFFVTVKSNLIAEAQGDTLTGVLVPGDSGVAKVKISNNTAAIAKGKVDVKFYLSKESTTDPFGLVFDAGDIEIGTLTGLNLNLASGQSATFAGKVAVPAELIEDQGVYHRVIAVVTPQNSAISENFTDDNTMTGGTGHVLFNRFGDIQLGIDANGDQVFRKNVVLKYNDAAGNPVSLSVKGGGFGEIFYDANGTANKADDIIDLYGRGVNGATVITAKTLAGQHTPMRSVVIEQPADTAASLLAVGTLALGTVDLTGDVSARGGLKRLTLGNLTSVGDDSGVIEIGAFSEAPGQKASIKLGQVTDYYLASGTAISSLSVLGWRDMNTTSEFVRSMFLDTLTSKGNFEADLYVTGGGLLKSVTVDGSLKGSLVFVAGNVGAVTLGGMDGSQFLAGTKQGTVPDSLDDFTAVRSIASFIVKGTAGLEFKSSYVAASKIASIQIKAPIGNATSDPAGTFGVIADRIAKYQRGTNAPLTNLDARDLNGDGVTDATVYDSVGTNYKVILL